ncbi:hypothetical protein OAO24_05400 [Methylophilaceae bacterium]|nr:hypothetical protein [Methylophilaceae bacterium]|tara:strand:- start:1403 stop:2314 length:912 start_codon:yes stop_codon:yes gene_type:complete
MKKVNQSIQLQDESFEVSMDLFDQCSSSSKSNLVLTPLTLNELKSFFDKDAIKVINFFLKRSIFSQPELIKGQTSLPIHIPKEHIEQWVVQALGVNPKGAGSYPVDVIANNWAADVKMLSSKVDDKGNLKNGDSGETSLAQKFSDDNFGTENLDTLFTDKKFDLIWKFWKKILVNKYKEIYKIQKIQSIYYFFILRAGKKFHLCGLKVDLSKLKNTAVDISLSTKNNIRIKNYINDEFGNIKIYKAKKRLELRLKAKKWVEDKKVITFDSNFKQRFINIRKTLNNNKLDSYVDEIIKIFKQDI